MTKYKIYATYEKSASVAKHVFCFMRSAKWSGPVNLSKEKLRAALAESAAAIIFINKL